MNESNTVVVNDEILWEEDRTTKEFLDHFKGHTIFVSMKDGKDKSSPIHYHEGFDKCVLEMERRGNGKDENKYGSFFTVNELDESLDEDHHRTAKMLKRLRAVFLDDDNAREVGCPRLDWPIPPSLIVESSPGKFHYHWLIAASSSVDKDEWQRVQIGIVEKYNGDNQARDIARYLRLPGSTNWKEKAMLGNGEQWNVRWAKGSLGGLPYSWKDICKEFPPFEGDTRTTSTGGVHADNGATDEELMEAIKSGKEYHGPLLNFSYRMKQDKVSDSANISLCRNMMLLAPPELRGERWQTRFDDIPRMVRECEFKESEGLVGAIDGAKLVELGDAVTKREQDSENASMQSLPRAPGPLGDLEDDAYRMQQYQYSEVAMASALGLVAGITGRRCNIEGMGLNVYFTLIMDTGMGKDSIGKFICGTLMSLNEYGASSSLIGAGRFTGPKAVIDRLKPARCQVSVFTEAGLLLKSKAGDQAGLGRMLLSLYTNSGSGDYSNAESYSKKEDSIPIIRAPCLSIVNEATGVTLNEAFRDARALEVGQLPRQSIIKVKGKKPYRNRNRQEKVRESNWLILGRLVKFASETQAHEDPKSIIVKLSDEISEEAADYCDHVTDRENAAKEAGDKVLKIMLSRLYVKALKYAALATVYNYSERVVKDPSAVIEVPRREWEWAKEMAEWEIDKIPHWVEGSGIGDGDLMEEVFKDVIAPGIIRMQNKRGKGGTSKGRIGHTDVAVIEHQDLYQMFKSNKKLKDAKAGMEEYRFDKRNPLEIACDKACDSGYLVKFDKRTVKNEHPLGNKKLVYVIQDVFGLVFH